MKIQLSDHFDIPRLLRFTLPSVVMMIFTSVYGVVDGFFVSNYVGKTAFAAINLIMPLFMIIGALGFMLGTGGSALVSMKLGAGEGQKANEIFSLLIYVSLGVGLVASAAGLALLEPIARLLGADAAMLPQCVAYGRVLLPAMTAYMLQYAFQSFLIVAEKPTLGLVVTVAAGVTNMLGDWLLVGVLGMGVAGAALATGASACVGGFLPLVYFAAPGRAPLHLGKARWDGKSLAKACTNGASEFMTNISMSVVNICYNYQLLRLAGQDGVAAYGVIMYVTFIFVAVFIGYSVGAAPVVGYHYGAGNRGELHGLLKNSLKIIAAASVLLLAAGLASAGPLATLFVGYDAALLAMTRHGFALYALSFLICGFNIYASSFFTALNNGVVSAAISFLRTLVFQIAAVGLLPLVLGLDGVWLAIVLAEGLALAVSVLFLLKMRPRYGY